MISLYHRHEVLSLGCSVELTLIRNPLDAIEIRCEDVEYSEANAFRPAAWRSLRAQLPGRRKLDQWTRRVSRFRDRGEDLCFDAGLHAAHSIFRGDRFVRAALDARILATESPSDIASRLGCAANIIEAYEAIFFDVRSRLMMRSFVVHEVIRIPPTGVFRWPDVREFWMKVGYWFGPRCLENVLSAVRPSALLTKGLDAYFCDSSSASYSLKLLLLSDRLPIPSTATELKRLSRSIRMLEALSQRLDDSASLGEPARTEDLTTLRREWDDAFLEAYSFVPDRHLVA